MSPSPSMENGRAESDVGNKSCKNNKKKYIRPDKMAQWF